MCVCFLVFFFFNDTATTEIYTVSYTLSLHDALPLYHLTGNLTPTQIDQLMTNLLADPVIQEARLSAGEALQEHIVDVFFHAGVTDTLAESVVAGAQMLGITGLEHVETGRRYLLDTRLSAAEVRTVAEALLYNPVIQQYEL